MLTSHISANAFVHVPWATEDHGQDGQNHDRRPKSDTDIQVPTKSKIRLFFFIPGNPGLIDYYKPFLALLVESQRRRNDRVRSTQETTVIVGLSLGGFEVAAESAIEASRNSILGDDIEDDQQQQLLYPPASKIQRQSKQKAFSLQEQIQLSYARVEYLSQLLEQGQEEQRVEIEVVLAGHSVGTYICLEIVRLWHQRHVQSPGQGVSGSGPSWRPTTCMLLTPTIQDLHLSPSGLIATPLLKYFPSLPALAHALVHSVLLRLLPVTWLPSLVSQVTGMAAGSHGLQTTVAFLRSEMGVRQALYMADCELKEIRQDKWGREVWGASQVKVKPSMHDGVDHLSPRLIFWFAMEDHWIAEATKEAILRTRAPSISVERNSLGGNRDEVEAEPTPCARGQDREESGRPRLRILETKGLVHAWCLEQSEIVAVRVSQWLEDIEGEDG